MRVVAILQARLHSTRLPGKMLLPLLDKPLVQHVIERTQRATKIDDLVLAVPARDAAEFAVIANGRAWLYSYPLDEADLVGRYLSAAQDFDADLIVRVPCDNPCVDPVYIDQAVTAWFENEVSFYSNTTAPVANDTGAWVYVDGIGAEVLSLSRLKWLDLKTRGTASYREHPHTALLYEHHQADLRLDVNTMEDYLFIKGIFAHFGHNHFTSAEVVAYLITQEVPDAAQIRLQQENH